MEASALRAPNRAALPRPRLVAPGLPLRLKSDEQLVALFRAGQEDAFRTIYERYRARIFAYTRQMLPGSRQDAEDALQDVFIRAYRHLRTSDRELALRPWLYRVAHNRCIDVLRRPVPPSPELLDVVVAPQSDPFSEAEQREDLRKLLADMRRLPDQQRSALLMRELEGCAYDEIAAALDTTVPAVKSLLVRARVGLAQATESRDAQCCEIREGLALARDRGVRATGHARRHLRDCPGCRAYKTELRAVDRRLAALTPGIAPLALLGKLLGSSASGGAGAGAAAAGGSGAASAASGTLLAAGATKVVAVVAVAAVATGGAVEIQHKLDRHPHRHKTAVSRPLLPAVRPLAPASHSEFRAPARTVAPAPVRRAVAPAPAAPPVSKLATPETTVPPPATEPTSTTPTDPAAIEPPATTTPTATTPADPSTVTDPEATAATDQPVDPQAGTTTAPSSSDPASSIGNGKP